LEIAEASVSARAIGTAFPDDGHGCREIGDAAGAMGESVWVWDQPAEAFRDWVIPDLTSRELALPVLVHSEAVLVDPILARRITRVRIPQARDLRWALEHLAPDLDHRRNQMIHRSSRGHKAVSHRLSADGFRKMANSAASQRARSEYFKASRSFQRRARSTTLRCRPSGRLAMR
jgi:hypothetical protein